MYIVHGFRENGRYSAVFIYKFWSNRCEKLVWFSSRCLLLGSRIEKEYTFTSFVLFFLFVFKLYFIFDFCGVSSGWSQKLSWNLWKNKKLRYFHKEPKHVSTVRANRTTDTTWELSHGKLLISSLLSFSIRFLSFKRQNTLLEHHGVDFIAVITCWLVLTWWRPYWG